MKIEIANKSLKKHFDRRVVRKFIDMSDRYKNPEGVKGNPLIYTVYIIDFDCFESGLTVIEPGTINKEYHMTKGHKHKKPTKEIYILLNGKGKLIIQGKKAKVFNLKKDETFVLPKNAGHRLVNIGSKKLEVLTIYEKKAGHNYDFKFTKRFFRK